MEPLHGGMTTGEAIAAVFAAYAAQRGKPRWGDKTPLYMQHLDLLDRLFPDARFVHPIRDGRDAALSFLAVPPGLMTEGWGHPRDAAGFACQWAIEVRAARRLGARVGADRYLEVRYEELVADPDTVLRAVCAFAELEFLPRPLHGQLPEDRLDVWPPVVFQHYPDTLRAARFDIGLSPLADDAFNAAKSNVKWLEYSACAVATVASPVHPYRASIVHGETGLLASTPDEWYDALALLVHDAARRRRLAAAAEEAAWQQWSAETQSPAWLDLFDRIA